ncbi:MAG: hypothetical protein IRY95_10645 [Clostridia bacterium]|nr:hypothetical protein [Clostridia bacterium]
MPGQDVGESGFPSLEVLKRTLVEKMQSGSSSLADLLRELGLGPDNADNLRALLARAGFAQEDVAEAEGLSAAAERLVAGLSPEARRRLAALYTDIVQGLQVGPVPPDLQRLIQQLTQGT